VGAIQPLTSNCLYTLTSLYNARPVVRNAEPDASILHTQSDTRDTIRRNEIAVREMHWWRLLYVCLSVHRTQPVIKASLQ